MTKFEDLPKEEQEELLAELREHAAHSRTEEYFGRTNRLGGLDPWERKSTMEKIFGAIFEGFGKEETLRQDREEFIQREEERDERYREIMEEEYPYIYEKYILGYDRLLTLVEQYRSEASSLRSELDNM